MGTRLLVHFVYRVYNKQAKLLETFKQWIMVTVAGKSHGWARLHNGTGWTAQQHVNLLRVARSELVTRNGNDTLTAVAYECAATVTAKSQCLETVSTGWSEKYALTGIRLTPNESY